MDAKSVAKTFAASTYGVSRNVKKQRHDAVLPDS